MTRKKDIFEKMEVVPLDNYLIEQKNDNPLNFVIKRKLKEVINELLSELEPREQLVLQLKFGLNDGKSRTFKEVGEEIGITQERVRQLEQRALDKLKHPTRARKLRGFLQED